MEFYLDKILASFNFRVLKMVVKITHYTVIRFISDNYENLEICKTVFGGIIEKLVTEKETTESDR